MPTDTHHNGGLFVLAAPQPTHHVQMTFDGNSIDVPAGVSVAAALLISGARQFRSTPVSAAPRAPYCMMGVCFECLVQIDGRPGRQSCLTAVRDGMVVECQHGASALTLAEG